MNAALENLRVLDLSSGISGAYGTRLMAGWGAEVIKIEQPGIGDTARHIGPFGKEISGQENSALFAYLNTNKKSITLNIATKTGVHIFKELLKDADVVIENFQPGKMAEFGLDYEVLEKLNPGIILTSVTWFGQNGPYAGYQADGMVAYAMGGQMYVCGWAERAPLNSGASIAEYFGGLYGFIGTMTALQYREKFGEGQQVDVAIFECMAGSHQFTLTWPAYSGVMLERPGWPGSRAPLSFYRCADGYVNLRLQGIEMGLLAQLFSMPELAGDARFTDYAARNKHIGELETIVAENIIKLKKQEVFRQAGEWRQLCGYVATPEDLLKDPQYQARDFWVDIEHQSIGKLKYPGAPVKISETSWQSHRAPRLGEHNAAIYEQRLGYTKDDIVRLRELSII